MKAYGTGTGTGIVESILKLVILDSTDTGIQFEFYFCSL